MWKGYWLLEYFSLINWANFLALLVISENFSKRYKLSVSEDVTASVHANSPVSSNSVNHIYFNGFN